MIKPVQMRLASVFSVGFGYAVCRVRPSDCVVISEFIMKLIAIGVLAMTSVGVVDANEAVTPGADEAILLHRLAVATDEAAGRLAESALWEQWFSEAPGAANDWLQQGRAKREAYDYEAAENWFDRVVEAAPGYAEGYNQRAFVRFLREDFDGSLADLEKTLALKPWHFGALSGMYHVLRIQNRHGAAFALLSRAVAIHPWIQERGALPKDMWPEHYRLLHEPGQKI